MYCPKCGKENLEDARFCMHCGADLSEYKVEISPKVEVSPKISVSAKAEGGVALKWKQKPEKYAEIKGYGKLSVFNSDDFVFQDRKPFCPLCGNYACLKDSHSKPVYSECDEMEAGLFFSSEWCDFLCRVRGFKGLCKIFENGEEREVYVEGYGLLHCIACDRQFVVKRSFEKEIPTELIKFERYFVFEDEKIPAYTNVMMVNATTSEITSPPGGKDEMNKRKKGIFLGGGWDILKKYKWEKKESFWILRGTENILKFKSEKFDGEILCPTKSEKFYSSYRILCPICKQNYPQLIHTYLQCYPLRKTREWSDGDRYLVADFWMFSVVVVSSEICFSLWKCETCGKFLVHHNVIPKDLHKEYIPKAYPL